MQLCLVNNDPIATLLITHDGEPLFSIETPPLPHSSTNILSPAARRQKSSTTTIKRIERWNRSIGQVETEVGVVEYRGPEQGMHLQLCAQNHALAISERPRKGITEHTGSNCHPGSEVDNLKEDETSWEFTGPDAQRYKWQLFLHSPVLLIADNSCTPLARYRRAKLGIVSRSRRAFLEILPAGINLIDLIVVTFVGFMKQRVLIEGENLESTSTTATASHQNSTLPTNDLQRSQ